MGFFATYGCIKSLQFMDLGNPLKVIVHYLLIGGMTGLGHRDGVPIVSALACITSDRTYSKS